MFDRNSGGGATGAENSVKGILAATSADKATSIAAFFAFTSACACADKAVTGILSNLFAFLSQMLIWMQMWEKICLRNIDDNVFGMDNNLFNQIQIPNSFGVYLHLNI